MNHGTFFTPNKAFVTADRPFAINLAPPLVLEGIYRSQGKTKVSGQTASSVSR
jgi:hypothetical protein